MIIAVWGEQQLQVAEHALAREQQVEDQSDDDGG
jgi:hypothetical protein